MKIRDKLRQAREKSLECAREGWQETCDNLQDVQRRIRQRMRIFPRKKDEVVSQVVANQLPDHQQRANAPYQGIQIRKAKSFFTPKKKPDGNTAA